MATEDDSDIPETGALFTFGKSKFADNAPNKFWIRNDRVVQVACGDEHTALVAESGRVFTFGANDWGQLGLGHTKPAFKPSCIKSLKSEKIYLIGCGRSTTYAAAESGKLYSFGANGDGQLGADESSPSVLKPVLVKGLEEQKYKMVCGGADHAAALTEAGDVYIWGSGSEGQLGLGSQTESPTATKLPLEEQAVGIACGYYHTAVVTESGKLYTFGETEGGKLGLGDDVSEATTPQEVKFIEGKVTWVACGGTHTVALTADGLVYTFGDGSQGQLGHGTVQLALGYPQQVALMRGTKLKYASCGENHTALISDKGELYTFGDGRHGKLALGEENFANQFKPSTVTRFEKFIADQVSCGGCHMLVLAHPRLENGNVESSDEEEESLQVPKPSAIDALRKSDDLELSGSFSARDRRRETLKDPMGSIGSRTLPALNGGNLLANRSLPPLNSTAQSPLAKSTLPPLRKEEEAITNSSPLKETIKSGSEEEADSGQESEGSSKPPSEADDNKRLPVAKPRTIPRVAAPKPKEDSSEDSEEESEEEKPSKIIPAKPIPAVRRRPPFKSSSTEEDSEDSQDSERGRFKKPKGKKKSDENQSEKSADEGKYNEKAKKKKKKKVAIIEHQKPPDSEDDKDDDKEDEESARSKKIGKGKKDKKKSLKKKSESEGDESGKDDKKSKKMENSDSEDDDSEKEKQDKVKKKEKNEQKSDEEEDEGEDAVDAKKEPEQKKKSKLCVIL